MADIVRMAPRFQWDSVINSSAEEEGISVVEIAGAPIMDSLKEDILSKISGAKKVYVFYNGEEKAYGCGEPASNFRSKVNSDVNNIVVKNIKDSFEALKSIDCTVCLSSYARSDRLFTFKMTDEGKFVITSNTESIKDCSPFESVFNEFLKNSNITDEHVKRIRLSSEGAGFRSMMADVLSMLIQVDVVKGGSITTDKKLSFDVFQPGQKDSNGHIFLKKMKLPNGSEWTPVEGNDYLYINHFESSVKATKVPVTGSNYSVFDSFWKLLDSNENIVKKSVRDHFCRVNKYHSYRDYCMNDTDDAFTVIAIIHAFKFADNLNECEIEVLKQFKKIIKPWYDELGV